MSIPFTAKSIDQSHQTELPLLTHLLIGGTLVLMALLARYDFFAYTSITHEDHLVEWSTVVFYVGAALLGFRHAFRNRRVFDGLVALYCLLAGGEEFSWGQRLLGLSPPKFFMEGNVQQEINLHNFFGSTAHDLLFAAVTGGYFLLLPLLKRQPRTRQLSERFGVTAPPTKFIPWAVLLIILEAWHLIYMSTEWYESLLASMFFFTALAFNSSLTTKRLVIAVAVVLTISQVLTKISESNEMRHSVSLIPCAQAEAQALLKDITQGNAATGQLRLSFGHQRVYAALSIGTLNGEGLTRFRGVICPGPVQETQMRRQYTVDPWGSSYWLYTDRLNDGSLKVIVYSFGPNRRRDSGETANGERLTGGDDIAEAGILSAGVNSDGASPPVFSLDPVH